jgi:ribonucleotide monophosphatase NagD (HAD superfamily)
MGLAWASSIKTPIVLGKPNTLGLEMITKTANVEKKNYLVIGDRLDTDIITGIKYSNSWFDHNIQ